MNLPALVATSIATRPRPGRPGVPLSDEAYKRRIKHYDEQIALCDAAIFSMMAPIVLIDFLGLLGLLYLASDWFWSKIF